MRHIQEQEKTQNFPGVPVDKNPSANAGDTGLIPALRRFHTPQSKPVRHKHEPQLLKPIHLKPVLHNKRSHHNETLKHQTKSKPLLTATRERHAATKTQHSGGKKRTRKDKHRELLTDSEICYNIFRV